MTQAPTCKRRTCTSEKGILFLSKHRDNLGDVAANSPEECCMACDRHPQCTRYSYYDGSCTLKKASSQWTPGTALTSGLVVGGCECRLSTSCPKSAQSCGAGNWLDLESCQCKCVHVSDRHCDEAFSIPELGSQSLLTYILSPILSLAMTNHTPQGVQGMRAQQVRVAGMHAHAQHQVQAVHTMPARPDGAQAVHSDHRHALPRN
jgi:hypothetical protein